MCTFHPNPIIIILPDSVWTAAPQYIPVHLGYGNISCWYNLPPQVQMGPGYAHGCSLWRLWHWGSLKESIKLILRHVSLQATLHVLTVTYLQLNKKPPWFSVSPDGKVIKMLRYCLRARYTRLISLHTVASTRPSASPTLYKNIPQAKKHRAMQTDCTVVKAWLRWVCFLIRGSSRLQRYSSEKPSGLLLSLKTLGSEHLPPQGHQWTDMPLLVGKVVVLRCTAYIAYTSVN